jgi:hypothetical protein
MTVEAAKYFIKFTTQEPFKSAIAVNPYDDSWTDSFVNTYVTNFTTSEHHPGWWLSTFVSCCFNC